MKSSLRVGTLAAVVFFLPVILAAQRQSRSVFINATDASGAPVTDLTAADFDVREGDAKKTVTFAGLMNGPMRILLVVDTSESTGPFQGQMKAALNGFIDAIPEKHEIGIISIGRMSRVRIAPTTDRAKLKSTANSFALDGGGVHFLDMLREAESRFQKQKGVRWPVYAIFITDGTEGSAVMDNSDFTKISSDLFVRGTTVHAAVMQKVGPTPATNIVTNFAKNTGGAVEQVTVPAGFPDRIKALATRIASDAEKMATRYPVDYESDAKYTGNVDVVVTRPGVSGKLSLRRAF